MKISSLIFLSCFAGVVYADGTEKVMGSATYANKNFDSLEIMGTLSGTALKASSIEVYGPANLKDSSIGTAVILGPLTAQDTVFKSTVEVHGPIHVVDSSFKDALSSEGTEIELVFENSSAESISLTSMKSGGHIGSHGTSVSYVSGSKKKEPKGMRIILKGKNTIVTGPIEFINEAGTVLLADDATFKGQIINGKIVQEASDTKKTTLSKEEGTGI